MCRTQIHAVSFYLQKLLWETCKLHFIQTWSILVVFLISVGVSLQMNDLWKLTLSWIIKFCMVGYETQIVWISSHPESSQVYILDSSHCKNMTWWVIDKCHPNTGATMDHEHEYWVCSIAHWYTFVQSQLSSFLFQLQKLIPIDIIGTSWRMPKMWRNYPKGSTASKVLDQHAPMNQMIMSWKMVPLLMLGLGRMLTWIEHHCYIMNT